MTRTRVAAFLLPLITLSAPVFAQSQSSSPPLSPQDKLLREIYQELVEINTTDSAVDSTQTTAKRDIDTATARFAKLMRGER